MALRNRIRESYSASSVGEDEHRSFDEIYGADSKLFEDAEDLIDPRFRKLFESVYQDGKTPNFKRLREEQDSHEMTRNPNEDDIEGIPASLNSSEMGTGEASSDITESDAGESCNCSLFNKRGRKLREMLAKCDSCGKTFNSHDGGDIIDGMTVCQDCLDEGEFAGEEEMYKSAIGDYRSSKLRE
jgi:hypothetical protein